MSLSFHGFYFMILLVTKIKRAVVSIQIFKWYKFYITYAWAQLLNCSKHLWKFRGRCDLKIGRETFRIENSASRFALRSITLLFFHWSHRFLNSFFLSLLVLLAALIFINSISMLVRTVCLHYSCICISYEQYSLLSVSEDVLLLLPVSRK